MIQARPLTAQAFAPFGHVARPGAGAVKMIRGDAVRLTRPDDRFAHAPQADRFALEFYEVPPEAGRLQAATIEHHPHSAQTFVPMGVSRWLVAVWPDGPTGAPLAFVAGPEDTVTYAPGIWHHGVVALDRAGVFASTMWRSDGADDTVFQGLPTPVQIGWDALS